MRSTTRSPARSSRGPTPGRSSRSMLATNCRPRSRTGQPSAPLELERRRTARRRSSAPPSARHGRNRGRGGMIIVRLLLFAALAAVGAAVLLWLVKRDPRYLRFIGLTLKFTVLLLLAILLWFAAERLLAPMLGPLL